ncbi:putative Receptor protein kinase [Quillaja saponaria]|uniref:Receptor protein kinase n=1 Tax=Quillaja saponaria TaxID=32244 RepID=A0AAD7KZV4_QUISA|nr:putative Receptor protein kinase [Quillaja saponaria]
MNKMLDLVTSNRSTNGNELQIDVKKGHKLRVLSYSSVVEATNNFSLENKLGEGGFGPVYKGKLPIGKEVAVKRFSTSSGQGLIEFKIELTLKSELQHMNLVQLLGCCVYGEEKMLIYEYMPNKSLDCFLFDSSTQSQQLDWKRQSKANTRRIVGTYGYMSPEYAMEGVFSEKSDVYSFGVLVLEIVTGRKSNSFCHEDCPLNLAGYAWELWRDGLGQELIDERISSSFNNDQMLRCIHVALLCVEENANNRLTMSNVITMLTNESAELPLPKRIAFYTGRNVSEAQTLTRESKDDSINGLSASYMYAR